MRLRVDSHCAGRRLDDVVGERLADALGSIPSRAAVRRLIMAGGVRQRGRALRAPGRVVEAGSVLEVTVRPDLVRRERGPSSLDAGRVLYEDDAVIAVDKPPGLPTVATADPARPHLVGLVERLLLAREGDAGAWTPLAVHQRLDRDTSGVVLFVKDPAANPPLAAQFAQREVDKTYLALTARPPRMPPSAWRVTADVDDRQRGGAQAARVAVTDFAIVEVLPRALLVEARPRTGRKHQIRIHLARTGLPILGDATYGGDTRLVPRLMLHAAGLRLRHPLTGAPLFVTSPLPADFRAVLARLRRRERAGRDRRRRR